MRSEAIRKAVVLILNYNGLKTLGRRLFDSIDSALNIDYESLDVVVIDNGSSDGSETEIPSRYRGDVIFIRLNKNYGYSGGNERGFRKYLELAGRIPHYVVIMNNDFIVKNPTFLKKVISYLERRPSYAIAQAITLQANGKRIESAGVFLDVMMQKIGRCSDLKPSECPEKLSYATFAIGSLMVIKLKPVMLKRGFIFKQDHFILWEETELALNMWSHGYKTIAVPEISGIHLGTATVKRAMPLAWYAGRRNKYIVYKETMSPYLRARYLYLPIVLEILNFYLRIFQKGKGRIASRGVIDGFLKRSMVKAMSGPFEPLLISPRDSLAISNLILASSKKLLYRYGYLSRLVDLTVDDHMLKYSARPFLVRV